VLVPVKCEFFALEGISQLKQTIDQIKGSLNPSLEIQGVVLTMHDARTSLPKEVASEVRAFFGAKVYETMIPRDFRVAEAPSHGKPIMVYAYDCPGSQAYIKLASEFLYGQCEPMDERHLMASTVTRARPPTTNGSVRGAHNRVDRFRLGSVVLVGTLISNRRHALEGLSLGSRKMRLNWAFFALAVVALVAYSLNRGERRIANHPRPNGTSPVLDAYIRQTVPLLVHFRRARATQATWLVR
jgi:hypothetical protein